MSRMAVSLVTIPLLVSALLANPALAGDGFIHLPVTAQLSSHSPYLSARQTQAGVKPYFDQTYYMVNITIGTPEQLVTVLLDTGSFELVVNPNCSAVYSSTDRATCNSLPRYTSSSTAKEVPGETGKSSFAGGVANEEYEYLTDIVGIGGVKIQDQQFGNITTSDGIPFGVLGIGPYLYSYQSEYPYVVDSLVAQNLTSSRAYSLDLRPYDSDDGSILFGGIDTMKFTGNLEKVKMLDMLDPDDGGNRFWINVTSLGITDPNGTVETFFSAPAGDGEMYFVDSGGPFTELTNDTFGAFIKAFDGVSYDSDIDAYIVPCALANQTGTIDFGFNGDGNAVTIPFSAAIWTVPESSPPICALAFRPNEDGLPFLGDAFLRAAYVVFDIDNRNIHVAQAASCGSNITVIGKGPDAVPADLAGECYVGFSANAQKRM